MASTAFRLEICKDQPKKRMSSFCMPIPSNSKKKFRPQGLVRTASILALLIAGVFSQAAVRSARFVVSAVVADSCTVQSSPYISIAYTDNATSAVSVQCALGSSYRLASQTASSTEFAASGSERSAQVTLPQSRRTVASPIRETGYSPDLKTSEASFVERVLLLTVEY